MIPAFPRTKVPWQDGMTLRDYFAARLAQMDLTSRFGPDDEDEDIERYCEFYYRCADLMVKARDADV